jgi:hypothetical protein
VSDLFLAVGLFEALVILWWSGLMLGEG